MGYIQITEGIEQDEGNLGVLLDIFLDQKQDAPSQLLFCNWVEDHLDGMFVALQPQNLMNVVDRKDLHIFFLEAFESHQLGQQSFEDFQKLVDIDLVEVIFGEDLGKEGSHEELQLLLMLIFSGEHEERFLLDCHFDIVRVGTLEVVYFRLPKDKSFCFDCSLLESDPPGHVLDMLNDEIHRDSVVSEPWNDNICVNQSW